MARQATLNSDHPFSINGMLDGIGDLGSNVVNLTTLQARLAAEDLRESSRHAQPALIGLAALIPLAFASCTVGLIGLASWMATDLKLALHTSLLLVAVGGMMICSFATVLVVRRLRVSASGFRRSREELDRNIAWLRTIMMHSGRS